MSFYDTKIALQKFAREPEWGYSLLSEIASARGPLGLPVERDLWFKPVPIDQVLRRERPSAEVKEGDV